MSHVPYPKPTAPEVSERMRRNQKTESAPERQLRSELHRRGRRFRKNFPVRTAKRLVRPDVVFTKAHLAVFVDGCFWHCCPEHGTEPSVNTGYWGPKLERNIERDREVGELLEEAGWTVLRGWEHEPFEELANRVETALNRRAD